jgi:DNA-binding response OmpR family regulator
MDVKFSKQESDKKKVLVIEDEPDLRQLTAWLLKAEGYQPLLAADGDEGLKIAGEQPVDLILLDIKLPGRYGWSVLSELKQKPKSRDIPVILFTASADTGSKSKAVQMGAADYLIKPIDAKRFKECIARVLSCSFEQNDLPGDVENETPEYLRH